MTEYKIYGSDANGNWYPEVRGGYVGCVQHEIDAYRKKYPLVCHVAVDLAFDMKTVPYNPTVR